jgi:hypothetical protein
MRHSPLMWIAMRHSPLMWIAMRHSPLMWISGQASGKTEFEFQTRYSPPESRFAVLYPPTP